MTVRILMCGEGGSNLELYRSSLVDEGYEVVVHEGGEAACEALSQEAFHLVIVDLEAPGEEALALVGALSEAGSPETVAVLKESPSPEDVVALREAGVFELLTRPFSMTKLALSVEHALARGQMEADLDRPAPAGTGLVSQTLGAGRVSELERELDELRRRLSQAELDSTRLEGATNRLESMKSLVRKKDQEIGLLQADLESAQQGLRHKEEQGQRVAEEHQRALERQEKRVDEHRKAREAAEDEVRAMLADLQERSRLHSQQLEVLAADQRVMQEGFEGAVQEHAKQVELLTSNHVQQLETLARDTEGASAGYQEHFQVLKKEMEELQGRYREVLSEKDELLSRIEEGQQEFRSSDEEKASLEARVKEVEHKREKIRKRLETEVRKHANEVKALVRERKKLVDETRRISQELSGALEEERKARKQAELEIEGMKVDLPQERRKVHALVEYQRSLTENVLAGILTVDTSGIITLGNDLAGEYLEVKLSDLLGAHVEQCEAFSALRPLFAEALAEGKAGPVEFDIRSGVTLRANATKVPFGPRELVLFSVIGPDKVEVPSEQALDLDSGPLASLGAAVAGNITDVQDFAVEIRGCLERLYGTTSSDSPAREEVNSALRKVGELIDFLRDIIEQAESYLS